MNTQQQISEALAGRAAQRDFVDELAGQWGEFTASFDALISSITELTGAAATAPATDDAHAAVFNGVRSFFGADGDWPNRAAELSGRLAEDAERISVLTERVHRETVNIGVIGVTGAGKSTLLRKLSGLGEEHIPSNEYTSSTATPSRIFHESGAGQGRAVLHLHTWQTFRDEVLQPLHERAGLKQPAPSTLDTFRGFPYPKEIAEGGAGSERYVMRLRHAQESLASYEPLLRGVSEGITLDRLRPFVAYPADESSLQREYHAVRSIDIFCQFPEVGAVRLGLVDLPGSGEAGLDVHKRFLTQLRNSTDLLFIVRRPVKSPSTDQDWDAAQLADDALAGVRREDFAHLVINRDTDLAQEYFEQKLAAARVESGKLGIDIRVCDIRQSAPPQVTEAILAPTLDLLAKRLAHMDRDAVAFVLTGLSGPAGEILTLCRDLNGRFDGWLGALPDEEKRRRGRIRELKNQVGRQLGRVRDEYDRLHQTGEPIAELKEQIERAGREIRQWIADGLGKGSRDNWIEAFQDAMAGMGKGDELDRQYNGARERVVGVFDKIDASLELAIERLHGNVASALRSKLTDKLLPDGPDNGAVLREFVTLLGDDARTLATATERLLALRVDYGSIFLRVGRPIVRKIEWSTDQRQTPLGQRVAGGVGQTVGTAVGGPIVGIAGEAAGEAAYSALARDSDKPNEDKGNWLIDHMSEAGTRQTEEPPALTQPPRPPVSSPPRPDPKDQDYPEAASWYDRLTATIEDVTRELEDAFHTEAQHTLRVLAAAVDLYKDRVAASPDIDVEYDRVCRRAQWAIWPDEFGEASAKVTADMDALRKQIQDTETAASRVGSLVSHATAL
ncbi:hypothetical protein ACWFRJ_30745 [Streptomyces sp. NPDC055239]